MQTVQEMQPSQDEQIFDSNNWAEINYMILSLVVDVLRDVAGDDYTSLQKERMIERGNKLIAVSDRLRQMTA